MAEQKWSKIGFGGGCHWCTEGVFASLHGVKCVDQGWISSVVPNDAFAEAVIVQYDGEIITMKDLVEIHLFTHSATSDHALRKKYRSAIYYFTQDDENMAATAIKLAQSAFDKPIITQVLPFVSFYKNEEKYLNYFFKNPENQFCKTYIHPKLDLLKKKFRKHLDTEKLAHIKTITKASYNF